ncbi:hypothetical protein [Ruminococcus albus]|uniref:hypothetical protein n=1 Tax=Ruminococcus albus TaxID=1264 RepID=UPI000466624C|nr:hypothetical protein [Ruminococcus albus]
MEITEDKIVYGKNTFTIVNEVPDGYKIWNIGPYMLKGFIPLCRLKQELLQKGLYVIEKDCLLAIKSEGSDKIMAAIGGGYHTVALMEKFLSDNPKPKEDSWEAKQILRIKVALPYMRKIKGL